MSLAAGVRLGPYEIVGQLGAGGMGVVYRARDPRLGREVAIKVLSAGMSGDPDSLRRLEQEARAVGTLSHPNIMAIHDIGFHDLTPYVVSELLEGDTLRERLAEPLTLRKALDYATQIARGLAAAHEKGIIHRDLKPENVFVTRDGRIKILDFGLAKMTRSPFGSGAGEMTASVDHNTATTPGTVMGTVGYMAPEQVRGKPADSRSDIFAFGTVFYEMLTGRRAFHRDSAVETMGAILKEEPPELRPSDGAIPGAIDRVLRRCLEKRPEERFQSARDLAFALEAFSGLSVRSSGVSGTLPAATPSRRAAAVVSLVVLALLASLGGAFLAGRLSSGRAEPTYKQLTFRRGRIYSARFAPDGQTVVYSATWEGDPYQLLVARPESPESRALGLNEAHVASISPSSEMALLFVRPGRRDLLGRAPLAGGAPREVLEDVDGADWGPDGSSMAVLRAEGGLARVEYPIGTKIYESRGRLQGVSVSPGGDRVALLESPDEGAGINSVVVVDRKGKSSVLSRGWRDARKTRWSPDGNEVWFSAGEGGGSSALHAVDLRGRDRIVLRLPGRMTLYDVSRAGAVLLARDVVRTQAVGLPPGEATERDLTWLDGSWAIDLSPDGRSLLLREEGEGGGPGGALYLRTTDGATAVRLGEGSGLALSPDGRWVLSMTRESPARLVLLPTGAGEAKHLEPGPIHEYRAGYWFPDGRRLLLCAAESGRPSRLYVQEVGGGPPVALTPEGTDTAEVFANPISPDGARIFAISPQRRVTLYPVAGGEPREVPGLESGEAPIRWSADGRALFVYRSPGLPARVYLLDVASGQRRFWKEIVPTDPSGAHRLIRVLPTPDGRAYVYSYRRTLSDLYLLEGVG